MFSDVSWGGGEILIFAIFSVNLAPQHFYALILIIIV